MKINSVHNGPVHHASVGHARVGLTGAHTGPLELPVPTPRRSSGDRRRQAKAALRQRQAEVKRGAGFLESLTLTRNRQG